MAAETLRVSLSGEYDVSRTAELREAVLASHGSEDAVVVDLAEVTFIDSSALRALLEVRGHLDRTGVTLSLINASANATRLLEITGMGPYLGLVSDS